MNIEEIKKRLINFCIALAWIILIFLSAGLIGGGEPIGPDKEWWGVIVFLISCGLAADLVHKND